MNNEHTIGIDFGTIKNLVAQLTPNTSHPECLKLGRERDGMPPSIALKDKEGEFFFVGDANDVQRNSEYTYISGFKMKLGSPDSLSMYLGKNNHLIASPP